VLCFLDFSPTAAWKAYGGGGIAIKTNLRVPTPNQWGLKPSGTSPSHDWQISRPLKESEWRWNDRCDNFYTLLLKTSRSHPLN
jgi:hypothetical protein